jgi:hypothetical protein
MEVGHERTATSEERVAATRLVLGLSAAVGGMAGVIGLVGGQSTSWLLVPTIALLAGLLARRVLVAAWAGVALWLLVLPHAHAEAMLGPLIMLVACLAIAMGPERLAGMVVRDWQGSRADSDEPSAGWIEDR